MLAGLPKLLDVGFDVFVDHLHGQEFLSILFDVVLFDGVPAFKNNEILPLLVDNCGFAELDVCCVGCLADVDPSLIEFGSPPIGILFLLLELVLIFYVVVNLNVLRSLDVSGVWILEVVNFLSLLFVYHSRLETQLFFLSAFF